jgi:hypothetical protein
MISEPMLNRKRRSHADCGVGAAAPQRKQEARPTVLQIGTGVVSHRRTALTLCTLSIEPENPVRSSAQNHAAPRKLASAVTGTLGAAFPQRWMMREP